MAIVSVNERYSERRARKSVRGKEYTRSFQVITDDPTTAEYDIFNNSDIPEIMEKHNVDGSVICQDVDPSPQDNSRLVWLVVCTYGLLEGDNTFTSQNAAYNPATRPWKLPPHISFRFQQYNRPLERAYQEDDTQSTPSKPVQNSANMPFDPSVMQPECDLVIAISRHEKKSDFDPNIITTLNNTINNGTVRIANVTIATHQGRLRIGQSDKKWWHTNEEYYTVQYEVEVDRRKHIQYVLNQGWYYLTGTDPNQKLHHIQKDGVFVTEPQRLKADGSELPIGDDAVYLDFQGYWDTTWASLRLPASH